MKLTPQQAPLYGDCVLTVRLTEDKELEDGDAVFYLLFSGSTLNHLTSTRKVNAATLETVTPGHDCCERVKVSLCASRKGFSVVVAEENFDFVQDEAYDSAQFLAANAGNQQALIFARFLDRSRPSPGDVTVLDEKITLAFRHLHLPSDWNVLGGNPSVKDVQLQETLMHFAARLGLCRLSKFLLDQPGGRQALAVPNNEGATPLSLALDRGFLKLHHLLTVEEAGQQDFESEASHVEHFGDSYVKHHCGLNVYTLTKKSQAETSMENSIEELNSYIHSHSNCPGNHVKAEKETALGQTTDLCHFHDDLQNCLVDKALSPGKTVHSDAKNTDTPDLLSADGERDCTNKIGERSVELDNTVETVGGEVAVFSFESKNKDIETKEEEEGSVPIVESENVSATSDNIQSLCSDLHTVENPLSGGNRNEETGMTSTGIVLDQEGLCERDSTSQEMITTEERASANASAEEARNQASDLTNDFNASMGQAVSSYCTSAVEVQSYTEISSQETSGTEPLPNLPTYSVNNSVSVTEGSSDQEMSVYPLQQCNTLNLEQTHSMTENGLVCFGTPNGIQGTNTEKPLDNGLDIIDESINLGSESELPDIIMVTNDVAQESSSTPTLVLGSSAVEASNTICKASIKEKTEDKTNVLHDQLNTLDMPKSDQQQNISQTEVDKTVDSHNLDIKTEVPLSECGESIESTELSGKSLSEKAQDREADLFHNEGPEESSSLMFQCPDTCLLTQCKDENITNSAADEPNPSLTHPSIESFVAELLQGIITELEETTSPVRTENEPVLTCVENVKLPPAGEAAPLHSEIRVCAEGELSRDVDTPSLFNDYDCLQNQEVVTEHSVYKHASTEIQEAAVTCQANSDQEQLIDCEQEENNGVLYVIHSETDSQRAQDDIFHLPLFSQSEVAGCDVGEPKSQTEEYTSSSEGGELNSNKLQTNEPNRTLDECSAESMVENEVEMTEEVTANDISDLQPLCLIYKKEEPEEVVKDSIEEDDPDEEDPEILKVSRASLHPIAEESLQNGDSGSDTASTCSDSEVSSDSSNSGKTAESDEEEPRKVDSGDQPLHNEGVSTVCLLEGPSRTPGVADGLVTDSGLLVNDSKSVLQPDTLQDKCNDVQDPSDPTSLLKEEDSGLDLSVNMEEIACPSVSDTEITSEIQDGKADDEVDFVKPLRMLTETQKINRDICCPIDQCSHTDLLGSKDTNNSTVCENFLDDGLETGGSSQPSLKQDSTSVPDLTSVSSEVLDEMLFTKLEEQSPCDATSSSSSTDDTTSLERHSSRGSDISLPHGLNVRKHKNRHSLDSCCSSTVTASVDERESEHTEVSEMEGEEMDSITEVSMPSSRSKSSMRSLSPFRRHSWEPGKHTSNDTEINRRSSLRALGDVVRRPSAHRRSMSWCPSDVQFTSVGGDFNYRSYSLEGLAGDAEDKKTPGGILEASSTCSRKLVGRQSYEGEDRGSLVSLTEEEQESDPRMNRTFQHKDSERPHICGFPYSNSAPAPHLTKSMSLSTISHTATETQGRIRPKRRISFSFSISPLVPKSKHMFSVGSSSSDEESDSSRSLSIASSSLSQSISEESGTLLPPSPSRKDIEAKSGTKVSRTFSYLKNKMSSGKKTKEKEKEKTKEKDKDPKEKEKDKKTVNGHLFSSTPLVGPITCNHCSKGFAGKDGYLCANCNSIVHKSCKENYTPCAKVKMKHQKVLQPHDTSSLPAVIMRNKGSQTKERPRSAIVAPDENTFSALISNRRPQTTLSISKSISTQNIAGVGYDESLLTTWRVLSQSTDSLHKICKVNESMESLVDEGMDMNEGQLMGEFEMDSRQLEAESWSQVVDSKFLRQLKKDVVKRQDVLYELMQTEMHHVRTLKIMSDVYSRGMVTELQFEPSVLEKIFPCLDDLLNIHSQFFQQILERKKESMADKSEKNFVIKRIGDILVNQFSGENAERMKKTYGKFCGHHNEAVNHFKDLLSKEKRFQAFMKKKMSSAVVRRLGIQECILLVTQRITKYPVLLQRILQYTKENEVEHQDVALSLNLVKDVITAVNSKVSNYEKKLRLHEIYSKTDSKSIQRMKSGQMFAKEDLKRRKLVRDGSVFLKSTTGRLKEVLAVLLSDILVFLQDKDQKYVFASLDQKSTVISLKKLIVREVAHEEKGLFLITTGVKDPEMVEVHASSKEERNSWIQTIQDTINTMNKDEDEGVPSESEEERRILDTKARELKEQLQQKDQQMITLLKEKEKIFQSLTDCCGNEESSPTVCGRMLFRADTEDTPRGEPVMKSAMKEVETLQGLVNKNLWGSVGQQAASPTELEPGVGPISLPRRAETFGGFDSHQLNVSKAGDKEEGEDTQDLRRTESDSILKKGTNANLMFKRNSEQVLQSVTNLHKLLSTLQAVVLQQDTYIEDQKLHLSERALTRTSSRPNSLIEQEKQRSLEKQRQELANLQKQQAQHLEEKRKREREWEAREKELVEREARLAEREELARKGIQEVEQERAELQNKKDEYQRDLERLRAAQKQLEKEREQMKKDMDSLSEKNRTENNQVSCQRDKLSKMPSLPAGTDSKWHVSGSYKQEHLESELSASPKRESLLRTDSKQKGKSHFPWHSTNQSNKVSKPKEKKDKKKGKGARPPGTDTHTVEGATPEEEIFC